MSWGATAWAWRQRLGSSADKLILIALADRHNDESGLAYPSTAWLAENTDLNRKTVMASLARLEAKGYIIDSGRRVGKTKQVKAYFLALDGPEKSIPKTDNLSENSPNFSGKGSQKLHKEPLREPIKQNTARASAMPADWSPSEFGKGTKSRRIVDSWEPDDLADQLERFAAHHRAKGSVFKSWQDAWGTWVLNSPTFGDRRNGNASRQGARADRDNRSAFSRAIDEFGGLHRDRPDGASVEAERRAAGGGGEDRGPSAPPALPLFG